MDEYGPWWHQCEIRDGALLDWYPVPFSSFAIFHGSEDLACLLETRRAFDPAWKAVNGNGHYSALPPWDCSGIFASRQVVMPGIAGELTWRSTCTAPSGDEVHWVTEFAADFVRNAVYPTALSFEGPAFEFPVDAYLGLRAGLDPLGLFERGGSLEGDLDELLFIAGVVSDPDWMSQWEISSDVAQVLSTFFLAYPDDDLIRCSE